MAIDGRLEWREWETADQQKRQAVSVVADTIQFLDGPRDQSEIGADGAPDAEEEPGAGGDQEAVGVGAGEKDSLVF